MGMLQKVRWTRNGSSTRPSTSSIRPWSGSDFSSGTGYPELAADPGFPDRPPRTRGATGLLSQKIKSVQRMISRETARISGKITESFRNIELVKSLGLTYPEIRRLHGIPGRFRPRNSQSPKARRLRSSRARSSMCSGSRSSSPCCGLYFARSSRQENWSRSSSSSTRSSCRSHTRENHRELSQG